MRLDDMLGFLALLLFTVFIAVVNGKSGSRPGKKVSFIFMWIMIVVMAAYLGVALWLS